jgi:hypothetical protein
MNSFDLQAVTFKPPCEWYSSNRPNPLLDHTGPRTSSRAESLTDRPSLSSSGPKTTVEQKALTCKLSHRAAL